MGWFGPKLEPGERILLRDPALREPGGVVLTAVSVMALVTLHFLSGRLQEDPAALLTGVGLFLGGVLGLTAAAALIARLVGDCWAITDRRVVTRQGALRRAVGEIRRERIDKTTLDSDDLLVHGDGRMLRLDLKGIRDDALQAALGETAPPAGRKADALDRILGQGEKLIFRHRMFWKSSLPGAPWSAAVTDRRVLLRRLHDRARYDEIPLAAIEEIEAPHEGSHRVYLHANGQRYEFRPHCLGTAERMHTAIRGVLP